MKMTTKMFSVQKFALLFFCTSLITSCDSDDDSIDVGFQGETKEYELQPVADSSIEGTVTFVENENGSTTIDIELEGAEEGKTYVPRLLYGNMVDGGEVALTLEDIEGDDGTSSTNITELDDETEVSYEDLAEIDGHIVIYLIDSENETSVATVDIGENELTGESVTYELDEVGDSGIAASVSFEERANGTTLITITSEDTEEDSSHPAFIHSGAVGDEQGDKVISLNPVANGLSRTNVSVFDDVEDEEGEAVTYEELVEFDGSLNIYLNEEDEAAIISQGNIGSNSEN